MRLQLEALTEECVFLCEEEGWLGYETGRDRMFGFSIPAWRASSTAVGSQ